MEIILKVNIKEIADLITMLKCQRKFDSDDCEHIYRRFIVKGDDKQLKSFENMIVEKQLSREDLKLILQTIKLNPDVEKQNNYIKKSEAKTINGLKIFIWYYVINSWCSKASDDYSSLYILLL